MIDINKIPQEGYLLAYSYLRLVFDRYSVCSGNIVLHKDNSIFNPDNYFEIHCFDDEKEYRLFRSKNDDTALVVSAKDEIEGDDCFIYSEEQFIDEKYSPFPGAKILVKNYFKFDENDSLYLDNYRLSSILNDETKQ